MVRIARPVRRTSAEIQATQTVGAVHLGRLIFTNLRRALVYVTAIHVPIAGLALLAAVLGLYLACLQSAGEAAAEVSPMPLWPSATSRWLWRQGLDREPACSPRIGACYGESAPRLPPFS